MKKLRKLLKVMLFCLLIFNGKKTEAKSIFDNSYVKLSPDGQAWTVYQELPEFDLTGSPGFWYEPKEVDFYTEIASTLREPGLGEHYYKYARKGIMPVGQWRVAWKQPRCIQGADVQEIGSVFHGLVLGDRRCQLPYFSGWYAYCADCMNPIRVNVYMSEEAAHSITQIPMKMDYYYLCPNCNHLEQGASMEHDCTAISYNRYVVKYIENGNNDVSGYMPLSIHMYNNANIYEGKKVTPSKNLALNSYNRIGYRFVGWNTKGDGTGISYADGAEIFNLTDENYDKDAEKGIVILYAQWERVESNLVFDANGGVYTGENPVRRGYNTNYIIDEFKGIVIPPSGNKVLFETNGGSTLHPVSNTRSFVRWDMRAPINGKYIGNKYKFTGPMNSTDTAVAVYKSEPIILPMPEKPNASFGGWYADRELTIYVGDGGDEYIPKKDVTLYADWVELRLFSEENYKANGGRGAVDLRWTQPDREEKSYRLYQSADGGSTYAQISALSASTETEQPLNRFFGLEQEGNSAGARTVVVPSSGIYELSAKGAQGGDCGEYKGGLGGSVTGRFYLSQGEVLTFLVGGQNGINGGGEGSVYGNGGGMTQIVSDRKGILLTAGGGGGAGASGDGQPGGTETNLVPEGSGGESGMSGGGGGHRGGASGEYIVHKHESKCFVRGCDQLYSGYCHTHYPENSVGGPQIWEGSYEGCNDDEGEPKDYTHIRFQKTIAEAERYNYIYAEYASSASWAREVLQEKSYVRLLDREGHVLSAVSPYDIIDRAYFHNGRSVRSLAREILANCVNYEGRWREYGDLAASFGFEDSDINFQFSYIPTEGSYNEGDSFEEKDYMVILTPVTDGTANWVNLMVLCYRSGDNYDYYAGWEKDLEEGIFEPSRVDGRYILYTNDRGDERYLPKGVFSEVVKKYSRSVPGAESFVNDDMSVVCRAVYYNTDLSVGEVTAESLYVFDGGFCDTSLTVRGEYNLTVCGYKEGQVISARPAYGGSSYVNAEYVITNSNEWGVAEGDGEASIRGISVGMTEAEERKGVEAPDTAAPFPVSENSIRKTARGSGEVLVSFDRVQDRGTEYHFYAESYSTRTGRRMCVSNLTKNLITTGIKGYLYRVDVSPHTKVTSENSASTGTGSEDNLVAVKLQPYTQYLHLAAADRAGNISGTVHVELRMDDPKLFWQPYTEEMTVESRVGDRDYENVYPAGTDRTFYVKADGSTPFLLAFESYILGDAREAYQINRQMVDAALDGEVRQRHITLLPYTVPLSCEEALDGSVFARRTEGLAILREDMYLEARRRQQAKRVEFCQAFTVERDLSGQTVFVSPAAGADTENGEMICSEPALDAANGLRLIADGEGPIITGLEALQSLDLVNRAESSVILVASAEDGLSGVRDFYVKVENLDNFGSAVYRADEDGVLRLELTDSEAIFTGDFSVTGHAVDNVGNETSETWHVTEFSLETEVERILSPHEPVFKRGESGILSVDAWGYVDRVEVEFPEFLSSYSQTFDYTAAPDYKKEERIQFMIPLYAPEGAEYEITVRAYKGDKKLEEHPSIRTIDVEGSVLDEIRTRIRG